MIRNFNIVKIERIKKEDSNVKTFFFDKRINAEPGQFVMLWIPRVDEKPFGFSYLGKECAVSVLKRGKFTKKMHLLKKGDLLGVRGPYGKGFNVKGVRNAVLVGGGCGIAILRPLAEKLKKQGVTCVIGAKNKEELFFEKELKKFGKIVVYTEDGSAGKKGFVTEELKEILGKGKRILGKGNGGVDCVYSCGPELMMLNVFKECEKRKVKCQLALERYFKCGGIGICGQCAIDGKLVCKDGPVFNEKQLRELKEFGRFVREKTGKKKELEGT